MKLYDRIVLVCHKQTCPPLAIMLTQRVDVGRDECSRQDRISALYANFPSFMLNTYTVFVAIFSWAINTWNTEEDILRYLGD